MKATVKKIAEGVKSGAGVGGRKRLVALRRARRDPGAAYTPR